MQNTSDKDQAQLDLVFESAKPAIEEAVTRAFHVGVLPSERIVIVQKGFGGDLRVGYMPRHKLDEFFTTQRPLPDAERTVIKGLVARTPSNALPALVFVEDEGYATFGFRTLTGDITSVMLS